LNSHAANIGHAGHREAKRYSGIMDWLTTVDHKKIGILYILAGGLFFVIGGLEAILIRLQLWGPSNDFLSASTFNQVITMHGTTMIFFAAMPLLLGLMNAIVPLQIGARDVAFPFVNAVGFWTFFFGGVILNIAWFDQAPEAGWTSYLPLASTEYSTANTGVDYYVLGLQVSGIGSLIGGINFLATIINMRAPGMTFMKMPMFTWTAFIMSALILLAFPALTVGLIALMLERIFQANFFDPLKGGNTVLFEHVFWIFGHPEVYILILPAFGMISEIVQTFSRKRLFGYSSMVFATSLIGFLGFMVWAHHMFTVGLGPVANALFSIATMLIAVPTGIKVFNWLLTMWGGSIKFTSPMMFAVGFIPTFVMGGVTGVMLSSAPGDYQYHDSYFVVGHFHYTIMGGLVFGIIAGLIYWWPKMFGRTMNETLGKWAFWLMFIGFHLTFFVMHFLGLLGMQRRIFTYQEGLGFDQMNMVSTIGAFVMGLGALVLIINMITSFAKPKTATNDPWEDGRTLEWSIPSPAPEYNFAQTPKVDGLDQWWKAKREGKTAVPVAEPLGPIHMPSPTILPFIMGIGLFLTSVGLIKFDVFNAGGSLFGLILPAVGLVIVLGCMFLRSVIEDHGFHISVEEIKGGQK
jgi:cytochrome c oxidase subunit 1